MENYIYMAGLIDGEGTIGIAKDSSNKFRTPYISITSTTYEIIEWLHKEFGGHISNQKTYQPHHKQSWSWKLRKKSELFTLLENILPYMKEPEKVRRAKIILAEYDACTPRNGKYSPVQLSKKIEFENSILHPSSS